MTNQLNTISFADLSSVTGGVAVRNVGVVNEGVVGRGVVPGVSSVGVGSVGSVPVSRAVRGVGVGVVNQPVVSAVGE